jgi:hypothetical protein
MLEIDDFKPVDLKDQELFKNHYNKFPPFHSDYSFSTMVSWHDYMEYSYSYIDGFLILMTKRDEFVQLRPPIGVVKPDIDHQVLSLAGEIGSEIPFGMIDSKTKDRLMDHNPSLVFETDRDFFDYVYLASDLAELHGKKYLKIRNMLNRFKKRYDYSVEQITSDNIGEIINFLDRWCLWKDCDKIPLLKSEEKALQYSMKHFIDLELAGITLKIDGEFEAAAIFEPLNNDTAVIHFEKAIPDFEGIYQAINNETAKILVKDFKFINRESDMGFPGLRLAKKKYQPHHMVEIYHLNKEQLDNQ